MSKYKMDFRIVSSTSSDNLEDRTPLWVPNIPRMMVVRSKSLFCRELWSQEDLHPLLLCVSCSKKTLPALFHGILACLKNTQSEQKWPLALFSGTWVIKSLNKLSMFKELTQVRRRSLIGREVYASQSSELSGLRQCFTCCFLT